MDKPAASMSLCLDSIRDKLHAVPLPLHLPVGQGKLFRGMVDLVTMDRLEWDLGSRSEAGVMDAHLSVSYAIIKNRLRMI